MAYPVNTDLKAYVGATTSTDDTLFTTLVTAAKQFVEAECGRVFEGASATRNFPIISKYVDVTKKIFTPGDDMFSVSSVENADGVAVSASDYYLLPVGGTPYRQIVLTSLSGLRWWGTGLIEVTAVWGYSSTCPSAIFEVILDVAAFMYRQRSAGAVGTVLQSANGTLVQPSDLPLATMQIINSFKRGRL